MAEEYGAVYLESFFAGLAAERDVTDPSSLRTWFQADGIHPNPQGVARIVEGVGPKVLELIEITEAEK